MNKFVTVLTIFIVIILRQDPKSLAMVVFCSGKPRSFIVGADLLSIAKLNDQQR